MMEKEPKFKLKIFHKILLTMIVVALVPFAGLLYFSGYQLEQDWRQNANLNLRLTANGLANKVNGWVDMNLRVLRENAALPDMLSMDGAKQKPLLQAIQSTYDLAYLVFTVGREGQNVGRSDNNPPQYYGDRSYFKQVMDGQSFAQEVVIGKTTQKPALILAGPIRTAANSIGGVMAMAMQLTDISQAVVGIKIGQTGFAILLDENNRVIAHGHPQQITKDLQDLSEHPALHLKGAPEEAVRYEEGGKRIAAYTQKTVLGWTLIVQQDYDEAFAPLLEAQRKALFLIGFTLILVAAVAYWLSRQLASPIWELTTVAENISRGNFDQRIVGTERHDEIGALARAIERMAISIKIAFERLRKKS
ncbi:MAG: cache domain-containing protein [Candidatus Competibacteraceae bacterium]